MDICGSNRYSNQRPVCYKNAVRSDRSRILRLLTQPSLSSLYSRNHAQKDECEGVRESVNPLPGFRQAFSISQGAYLHECVSVYLYRKLLVFTDEIDGHFISEVDVFGVVTPGHNVCFTGCIKQLPFFSTVSSKNEVPPKMILILAPLESC